jgi:hypothetical protein
MNAPALRRPPIRFGMLALGLLFLFTPTVNLFDLLPDCIGYYLLAQAIGTASDVAPYFGDARDRFFKLLWISASKFAALAVMLTIYSGDLNQRSIITVFAIGYAIVEAIWMLPAFAMLFEGFFYLGVRFGCDSAIKRDRTCNPERLSRLTLGFLILRLLGSCLPELALVPISEGDEQGLARMMLRLYPILVLISLSVVLILGLCLLAMLIRYFRRMKRDGAVESILLGLAEEKSELLYRRREKRTVRFLGIVAVCGALLGIDLVIDQIDLIPDFLSGICFIAFFLALGRRVRGARIGVTVAGIYTALSLGTHIFSLSYFSKFDILNLYAREEDAVSLYRSYLGVSAFELALSLFLSVLLAVALYQLVPHVAGSIGEEDSIQTRRLRRSMKREAIALSLIRSLSAVAWVVYLYYAQFCKSIELDPGYAGVGGNAISSNVPLVDGLWLLPPLLSIVELFVALHLTGRFRTESELTYSEI